jgi:hypothetical protein
VAVAEAVLAHQGHGARPVLGSLACSMHTQQVSASCLL